METTQRSWKQRLKDWSIVIGLLALCLLFGVYVWFNKETNPVQPGSFYTPPNPLAAGAPGEIIRSEPITTHLPKDAQAWRILYQSKDLNDQPIAVSGIVVAPTTASETPRNIIAWAHGTQGIYPACATSQLPDALTHIPDLDTMIAEGNVVVATDYPGLGTPGIHPYLVGKVEGQSVLDSIRAAHNLVPGTSTNYAVIGASQGGHAAMFAAQMAPDYLPDYALKGTVTQAGAFDLAGILEARMDDHAGSVLIPMALTAWSHTYPDIDMSAAIQPEYASKVEAVAHTCLTTPLAFLRIRDIPKPSAFLAVDPVTTEPWQSIIEENTPSEPVSTPLLLVHGTADEVIPFEGSVQEAARRCAAGEDVTFLQMPGAPHAAVPESIDTALGWIADRFAGAPSTSNCANRPPPGTPVAA